MICWCCGPGRWLAVAVPLGLASSPHAFSNLHASASAMVIIITIVIDPPGFSCCLGVWDGSWASIPPPTCSIVCSSAPCRSFHASLLSPTPSSMYIHQSSGSEENIQSKISISFSVSPPISSYSCFPASSHSVFLLSSRLREKAVSCILILNQSWVSSSEYFFYLVHPFLFPSFSLPYLIVP